MLSLFNTIFNNSMGVLSIFIVAVAACSLLGQSEVAATCHVMNCHFVGVTRGNVNAAVCKKIQKLVTCAAGAYADCSPTTDVYEHYLVKAYFDGNNALGDCSQLNTTGLKSPLIPGCTAQKCFNMINFVSPVKTTRCNDLLKFITCMKTSYKVCSRLTYQFMEIAIRGYRNSKCTLHSAAHNKLKTATQTHNFCTPDVCFSLIDSAKAGVSNAASTGVFCKFPTELGRCIIKTASGDLCTREEKQRLLKKLNARKADIWGASASCRVSISDLFANFPEI